MKNFIAPLCLSLMLSLVAGCGREDAEFRTVRLIGPDGEPILPISQRTADAEAIDSPSEERTTPGREDELAARDEESAALARATTTDPTPQDDEPASADPATDASAQANTFRGRVVVKGTPPKYPPVLAKGAQTKDAICAVEGVPDKSVVVGDNGGLANVVIWLDDVPDGVTVPEPAGEGPALDQQGCTFTPHVIACRTGVPLRLLNSDPVAHNVSYSGLKNAGFNTIVQPNGEYSVTFTRMESVPMPTKCDIHAWMQAYIFPVEHPWVAVTDENGDFEIPDLPSGNLEFRVWHELAGFIERGVKIEMKDGQGAERLFEVDASELQK